MAQHHPFRLPRGAGGVADLGEIVRFRDAGIERFGIADEIGESDRSLGSRTGGGDQMVEVRSSLAYLVHRVHVGDGRVNTAVLDDVPDLRRPGARVDRDHHAARAEDAEVGGDVLRHRGKEQCDAIARSQSEPAQVKGESARLADKLAVADDPLVGDQGRPLAAVALPSGE